MSYDNEFTTKLPNNLSEFSIDSSRWEVLKPLYEASSKSVKMLDQILTIDTVSSAVFSIDKA